MRALEEAIGEGRMHPKARLSVGPCLGWSVAEFVSACDPALSVLVELAADVQAGK